MACRILGYFRDGGVHESPGKRQGCVCLDHQTQSQALGASSAVDPGLGASPLVKGNGVTLSFPGSYEHGVLRTGLAVGEGRTSVGCAPALG